jgi:hypothetical protein
MFPLADRYTPDGQAYTDIIRASYQLVQAYPGPDGRPRRVHLEAVDLVRWEEAAALHHPARHLLRGLIRAHGETTRERILRAASPRTAGRIAGSSGRTCGRSLVEPPGRGSMGVPDRLWA